MQIGLFDEEKQVKRLSGLGDSIERLNKVIDWETFRSMLERVLNRSNKTCVSIVDTV